MSLWETTDHDDPEQIERKKRARYNSILSTISINKELKTGVFQGRTGIYETSFETCTCGDFQDRQLPCKHIYRLDYELEIIEPPEKKPPVKPKADNRIKITPAKTVHINYKGSNGKISERDIDANMIEFVGDKLYIYGYCHVRKMVRQFLASRITCMVYEGREITDFMELIEN